MATEPKTAGAGRHIRDKVSDRLVGELQNLVEAVGERTVSLAADKMGAATQRLTDYAKQGGGPGLIAAATGAHKLAAGKSPVRSALSAGVAGGKEKLKQALGKDGKGSKGKIKVTNIVEAVDVGVPVRVAYNQWTQFEDFPRFMKKVEDVEPVSDQKLGWKAQVFWSHRTWESTIVEQVPDERIVWRSKGEKGSVDGTVTFHEVTPDLTRILLVLEYQPQGLFERTGNIWRAQGRRVRLELKHFVRHVMRQTILHPDEVEGWRGEIRDGRVVRDHKTALAQEKKDEPRQRQPGRRTAREDDGAPERKRPGGENAERREEDGEEQSAGPPRAAPRARRPRNVEQDQTDRADEARPSRGGAERARRSATTRRAAATRKE